MIAPQQHSDFILSQVDELLAVTGIHLHQLDAIAFGAGPGSFMGVRLATGVAQGLAYAIDRPVIPVSTLQALAQSVSVRHGEKVLVGWDARMSAIYWGIYALNSDGLMQAVVADRLSAPDVIQLPDDEHCIATGNAWEVYESQLSDRLKQQLIKHDKQHPHAEMVARIAAAKFAKGDILPPDQAEPVYIRDVVAKRQG